MAATDLSPWHPLRVALFRNLLIANLVSDIGTFMQTVGAAWLMVSLDAGPKFVALTQTASALAFCVFALPAGALGDIVDRRTLILRMEVSMLVVAATIAGLTWSGHMTPWRLLVLTFALSVGDAIEAPSWRAVLPQLVDRKDIAAASALGGIEFNFARAVGPALAGLIIAATGVGATFAANAVSFIGVIAIVLRWQERPVARTTPPETVLGATTAALRYVRHSPVVRSIIVRAGVTIFFASGVLALLPSLARSVSDSAVGYGILLGGFGSGAVVGAVAMQRARARYSSETIVSAGVAVLGASMVVASLLHSLVLLAVAMLVAGSAWIVFISTLNALMQTSSPDWVRARVQAAFLLAFQGGVAAGSAVWGTVGERLGISTALAIAGAGCVMTLILRHKVALSTTMSDVSPWIDRGMPIVVPESEPGLDRGPVLVSIEYLVRPQHRREFIETLGATRLFRRRDGAYRWSVFQDVGKANCYLETFLVESWAEHLRQHDRQTTADRQVELRVRHLITGPPIVRHFVTPVSD